MIGDRTYALGLNYGLNGADAVRLRAERMIDDIADNAFRQGNTRAALARSSRYQRMVNRAVSNMLANSNG